MNLTKNIELFQLNKTPDFLRLIEHIQDTLRQRHKTNEQQPQQNKKFHSINHHIEYLKRCMNENPLINRVLVRFYHTIKNLSSQTNQFSSGALFENKINLEETMSFDNFYSLKHELDSSKISLTNSQSSKSTTNFIQSVDIPRQMSGLMTKTTLMAINKTPRQRTTTDIESLKHLLNRCEIFRHLPTYVRQYTARSLLFLTYPPNTILTRQNCPHFLVYIVVSGQCKFLLETDQTIIFCQQLNIGDIYGDESLQYHADYRLYGLITNENNHCNLIGFFSRDIRAYEIYLNDLMKQSLLEQLRHESNFITMQWRNDILEYFLKWSKYHQYGIDEIIYGNEEFEHENLYFIFQGQVSFVCLLEFPSLTLKYPEFYSNLTLPNEKISWRFLEIFHLSSGHYFGFESNTFHSWYLTRSLVDIISIPKTRFQELGYFARMIFDKLRADFLEIYPNEHVTRKYYIKYLQRNKFDQTITNQSQNDLSQKLNLIPEQHILSINQNYLIKKSQISFT